MADASNEWAFKTMSMADLTAPDDTQLRVEGVNEEVAQGYSTNIKELPPVDVFVDADEGTAWLSDGHHRYRAHQIAKETKIKTRWKKGTLRDAILHAINSNHGHGLHRSNADKRNAVRYMLRDELWRKKSDRWIATQAGVSHPLVASIRNELYPPQVETVTSSGAEPVKREGADGKAYPARQPVPKPTGKRKKSGAKMGFDGPQARGPQVDEYGNELAHASGELYLCDLCGEMVPEGHDGACVNNSQEEDDGTGATAPSDAPRGSGDAEQPGLSDAGRAAPDDGPLPGKPPPAPVVETPRVRVPVRVDLAEFEIAALHCVTEPDPTLHAELFDDWENTEGHGECPEADARAAVLKLGVRFE